MVATWRPMLWWRSLLFALLFVSCGSENATDPESANDLDTQATHTNPDGDAYVSALPDWEVPDTTTVPPIDLPPETFVAPNDSGTRFVCTVREVDLKRNFTDLTAVGANGGVLWPGALVQGRTVQDGTFSSIPVARTPITISIDLGVENATRRIENPTSATVQQAIAELQREADSRLGPIEVVPARLNFQSEEAYSLDQLLLAMGTSGKLSAPLKEVGIPATATVGYSVDVESGLAFRVHTIVVKLFQPMYTISFADEEKQTPGDYFAPWVTTEDFQDLESRGMIGAFNLPTYVKSVTYGRLMFFTMSNTEFAFAYELKAATYAALKESITGIGAEGERELQIRYDRLRRNSEINMVAFGGSQEDALAAVREGDFKLFFKPTPAALAVPLSYRINNLKDGSVAVVGDATKYKIRECQAGSKLRFQVRLDSIRASADLSAADPPPCQNQPIIISRLESPDYSGDLWNSSTSGGPSMDAIGRTAVVNIDKAAWTFTVRSQLENAENASTRTESVFASPFQLPLNPYSFDHQLSFGEAGNICTVRFNYTVAKEEVFLAPPAG